MNKKQEDRGSKHKVIGVSIIVLTIGALIIPAIIAYANNKIDSNPLASSTEIQTQASQASCLNEAYDQMEKKWKAADKDGDDKVSYQDGATDITTAYYDDVISCYRAYKTDDSDSFITDYQAKRQQETDKYTAWLEASKQPTYVPSYNNNYKSSINCRSSSIGSSTYTTCD